MYAIGKNQLGMISVTIIYLIPSRGTLYSSNTFQDEDGTRRIVWNKVADGFDWQTEAVELRHLEGRQRVVFISRQGAYDSGTALDDVTLTNGACPGLTGE